MANSGFRLLSLLALMFSFPILLILSLAVAFAGCGQPALPPAPPQVLSSGVMGPAFGIAVDDTNVYVSPPDPGPLLAIPVGGGTATPVGVQAEGRALAVDQQRLYWSDGTSVLACDKSNCTASTVILATSQYGVLDIALDDTNVYWGSLTMSLGQGQIVKAPKNGGTPIDGGGAPRDASAPLDGGAALGGTGPVVLAVASWPYNVAVDSTYVYWVDEQQPNSGVKKVPIAGGPIVQLAVSDPIEPMGLALDADNAYFMNGEGALFKVSKNGGPTQVMLSSVGEFPEGLATDGTNLYIGTITALLQVPLAGGFPTALATGFTQASFIALDATNVYLADGPTVLKVAK